MDAATPRPSHQPPAGRWVATLRRFVGADRAPAERCELCHTPIGDEHPHLIEPASHRIVCACRPCALLFDTPEAQQYRRVPSRARHLADFVLTDAQWEAFLIPINLAFFYYGGAEARIVAMYPGPAGATESALDLDAWDDLAAANPDIADLEADVEALLVNRVRGAREYYRLPIDRCYRLVGAIRSRWQGLSGGDAVRAAIAGFFDGLRAETGAQG